MPGEEYTIVSQNYRDERSGEDIRSRLNVLRFCHHDNYKKERSLVAPHVRDDSHFPYTGIND